MGWTIRTWRRGSQSASRPLPVLLLGIALSAACGGRSPAPAGNAGAPSSAGASTAAGDGNASGKTGTAGASAEAGAPSAEAGAPSAEAGAPSAEAGAAGAESCAPGRAPLRRLTDLEYRNSVRALLGEVIDEVDPLTPEPSSGRFGNDADQQEASAERVTSYFQVAKQIAYRATHEQSSLLRLAPCAAAVTEASAAACVQSTAQAFASAAFRRTASDAEVLELVQLYTSIRAEGADFADGLAGVVAAVLQAPPFLYRPEWGAADEPSASRVRLSADEIASRLSYLFWSAPPDDELRRAARAGVLADADGVKAQALRLLQDPRSHQTVALFFDRLLGLDTLPGLPVIDASYSPEVGRQLRASTQLFLEKAIFDQHASWPAVLTSKDAYVNQTVARFYGVPAVSGADFQRVVLDDSQRLGLLTQPSVMAANSNATGPSHRGAWVMNDVLCRKLPPPHAAYPDVPTSSGTARDRLTQIVAPAPCAGCHADPDSIGFAFENYDALGRYRTTENGAVIDANVSITGVGAVTGSIDLVKKLAALPETQSCLASHLAEFGYGKALDESPADRCLVRQLSDDFAASGYDIQKLLLDLTQTDAFLYLAKEP